VVVLSGTFTSVVADPDVHETVTGRPVTAVLADEKVQLDALATVAERATDPPVQGTGEGLAAKPLIAGNALADDTLIVVVADLLEVAPFATSFTV
jgi:hypothetical protein